jgi:LPXTG-motif cell wall-anchored protein
VRTAGRIFAGLFVGGVLYLGFGGAAHAQTPTPSPTPTPTSIRPTTTVTPTTSSSGTGGTTGGTTLPKTGFDATVPVAAGGAALAITVVLRRMLARG